MGVKERFGVYRPDHPFPEKGKLMTKEQLESNTFTKYAAGLMQDEELKKLEDWLKKNPQFKPTLAIIKQQVSAMMQPQLMH
ncbi:MAG: hypothetical protein RLZZ465_698 [Bacteroidota bacterium]